LDQKLPSWDGGADPDLLDVVDTCQELVSRLTGASSWAVLSDWLGLQGRSEFEVHGFDAQVSEFPALTRLWSSVIRTRRQTVFYVHRDEFGVDLAYMVTGSGDVWCWSEKHGWHRSVFKNLCTCDEGSRAHFADHLDVVSVEQLPAGAR